MAKKLAKKAAAKKVTKAAPGKKIISKAPASKAAKAGAANKPGAKPAAKPASAPIAKPVAKAPLGNGGVGVAIKQPGEFSVTTGDGLTPAQIGAELVAMFNRGEFEQIEHKFWSPDIESIEGLGVNLGWRGRHAVEQKGQAWMRDHHIHGASAEGPFVGSSGFAVRFKMDVETKSTGQRVMMDEVAVYTVHNGKIIREEFMYAMMG
ncbi:MAG: nuclear transport factor 2 family protein [Planctomycetota bacterium]|nr:nuclear transport factor 2 family protein [Planctomycetota bacterium]